MELNGQIQNGGSLVGSFGYETGDYNLLSNKPQINGVELVGNKTSEDLHITGGGTDDYNDLDNKPMINGVQLSGNLSPEDLGLAEINFPDDPTLYLNGSGEFTEPDYFSGDYDDLNHRPQINGVTLTGDKSTSDLLFDYDDLSNRPQIDGTTLTGDKTPQEIGCEPTINYPGDATQYLNGQGEFTVPEYFSGDYDDLDNKPQINGVTLSGNLDTGDLQLDYDDISGRPSINSIILTGNKSGNDLELTSGAIASGTGTSVMFEAAEVYNLLKCKVDFEPEQDLHGYSKPWPGGTGKNLFSGANTLDGLSDNNGLFTNTLTDTKPNLQLKVLFYNGATLVDSTPNLDVFSPGRVSISRTINNMITTIRIKHNGSQRDLYFDFPFDRQGEYTISINVIGVDPTTIGGLSFDDVMIESGTSMTTYEPYANICPISGNNQITVNVSPTADPSEGTDIIIQLGDTYYRGSLDAITGKLIITDRYFTIDTVSYYGNPYGHDLYQADIPDYNTQPIKRYANRNDNANFITNMFIKSTGSTNANMGNAEIRTRAQTNPDLVYINYDEIGDATAFNNLLSGTPLEICAELANPITIYLSKTIIESITGDNYITAEGKTITIDAATEIYDPIIKYLVNNR